MNYNLIKEGLDGNKKPFRLYRNDKTGTETKLIKLLDDSNKKSWWGFTDLFKIPIMRLTMARNITDLYTIGLTSTDIQKWCDEEKKLLKSNDPEKYEKLYSLILEKERLATFATDMVKQQIALCTVYILEDEERLDYFDEAQAEAKLQYWKNYPDLVAFFLTWHTDHIQRYIKRLDKLSTTVSTLQEIQHRENLRGLSKD
jgi:hypothetical protein